MSVKKKIKNKTCISLQTETQGLGKLYSNTRCSWFRLLDTVDPNSFPRPYILILDTVPANVSILSALIETDVGLDF